MIYNLRIRSININEIFHCFGDLFCKGLPAFHAFIDCDYTTSLKRKTEPLKILDNSVDAELGENITDAHIEMIESLFWDIYDKMKPLISIQSPEKNGFDLNIAMFRGSVYINITEELL